MLLCNRVGVTPFPTASLPRSLVLFEAFDLVWSVRYIHILFILLYWFLLSFLAVMIPNIFPNGSQVEKSSFIVFLFPPSMLLTLNHWFETYLNIDFELSHFALVDQCMRHLTKQVCYFFHQIQSHLNNHYRLHFHTLVTISHCCEPLESVSAFNFQVYFAIASYLLH